MFRSSIVLITAYGVFSYAAPCDAVIKINGHTVVGNSDADYLNYLRYMRVPRGQPRQDPAWTANDVEAIKLLEIQPLRNINDE